MRRMRGLTLLEVVTTVGVAGILGAIALGSLRAYGSHNRVREEAGRLQESLWSLRSLAVTGHASPCIDFPDRRGYRLFHDGDQPRNGYNDGDRIIEEVRLPDGMEILDLEGGDAPGHRVCYESKGIVGSATRPLRLRLGSPAGGEAKVVELLPSTGMARVQ